MAPDVSKMCVEACLFLHRVVVAIAIDLSKHPPLMLHDLPLKLMIARMSHPLLERHKQQAIVKQN